MVISTNSPSIGMVQSVFFHWAFFCVCAQSLIFMMCSRCPFSQKYLLDTLFGLINIDLCCRWVVQKMRLTHFDGWLEKPCCLRAKEVVFLSEVSQGGCSLHV